jgi:phytoene synthase
LRGAFDALFAIDDAMGDVVTKATEPALAAIKLAWWRERLEELDAGKVPAEPRLQAAADELLTKSISGSSLAGLEDGWAAMLEPQVDAERVVRRGARLFAMASSLLGIADPRIEEAGRLYALARIGHRPPLPAGLASHVFPRGLRPLTAMAALAARDAKRSTPEPQATPGRALALLRHRLTGRIG